MGLGIRNRISKNYSSGRIYYTEIEAMQNISSWSLPYGYLNASPWNISCGGSLEKLDSSGETKLEA